MLSLFFFLFTSLAETHADSSVPRAGLYSGSLKLTQGNRTVPFQMSLSFSQDEVQAEAEEILIAKRAMRASFVLDGEAGPYNFSTVSYFIEDGRMDMIYLRSGDGLGATPRFRLVGNMRNGTVAGQVLTASQGTVGTFSLSLAGGPQAPLVVTPKYSGVFRGTMKMTGTTNDITVNLSPSGGVDVNPSSYDFDFSPRKAGSVNVSGSADLAFTRVNIDYLRGTIEMVHVGGSGELALRGNLSSSVMSGTATSSRNSGTFEVRKD